MEPPAESPVAAEVALDYGHGLGLGFPSGPGGYPDGGGVGHPYWSAGTSAISDP